MTRRDDPAQWWQRTTNWALSASVTILIAIVGYIAVKWDKSSEVVVGMAKDVENMADDLREVKVDIRDIRKDGKEMRQDIDRIDATVDVIKDSNWFKRQVED